MRTGEGRCAYICVCCVCVWMCVIVEVCGCVDVLYENR